MMEYLLKVSFVIVIGFLFYKTVLQQESFFAINRLYLLCCLGLAFALPWVTLPKLVDHQGVISSLFQPKVLKVLEKKEAVPIVILPNEEGQVNKQIAQTPTFSVPENEVQNTPSSQSQPNEAPQTTEFSWIFWLAMLYGFGVAIFFLNLLFQIISTFWKVFTSPDRIQDGDYVIVNTARSQAPCSFFKYIFLHPEDYDFETYEQIIAHEKIHVRQGHTLDLLMAELAVIVLWFNPLIWLYKREVEKNIEYQTDAILLNEVPVSPDRYQMSLLQIACPHKPLSITTNYNQSLLKQRIFMMNAKKSTPHAFWKYSFLVPLFFGTLLLLNAPATSQSRVARKAGVTPTSVATDTANKITGQLASVPAPPVPAAPPASEALPNEALDASQEQEPAFRRNSININGKADMSQGFWYSHQSGNEYCLELKGNQKTSTWNLSRCFDKKLFSKSGENIYQMTKEAGTLQLTGKLEDEVSQGKYTFTENASFKNYLAKKNISSANENFLFHLFLGDVDQKYVDYLASQYQEINGDKLLELAIFNISQEDFKGYATLFQKYGNKKPTLSEVIEARIFKIDQQFVQELQAMGYKDLSLKKMMEAKIHKVSASYVEELRKAGFENLSIDKVIEAQIHRISPTYIKEVKGLGYGDLNLNKIIELKIHGVSANYIAELRAAGYDNLPLDKVIEAKIHGVNAEAIKSIQGYGFKNLSLNKLIEVKIHGVNEDFLDGLAKEGFKNLTVDKAIEAKIHGVTGDFIKNAHKDGYNLKSLDEYINVKIMGMNRRARRD